MRVIVLDQVDFTVDKASQLAARVDAALIDARVSRLLGMWLRARRRCGGCSCRS